MHPFLEGLIQHHRVLEGLAQLPKRRKAWETLLAYHKEKEDELIAHLVSLGYPPNRGPLYIIRMEHEAHLSFDQLWEHFDREETVLFPTIEERHCIPLDWRVKPAKAIIGDFPIPAPPPRMPLMGCAGCRYYGEECQGIEKEWWSDVEWEEFHQKNR